jgi:hypothetical protein
LVLNYQQEGFIITGGGFMVGGPGDVNGDGIPDIMISTYQQWQGKGNSYIMVYPRNITSPPTFLPSSQPTSAPSISPTLSPSLAVQAPTSTPTFEETTNEPVNPGTFPPFLVATQLPSLAPKTSKPTRTPSIRATTHSPTNKTDPPSLRPSRKPTANPTRRPTILPSTTIPSGIPSRSPTQQYPNSHFPTSSPSPLPTESLTTPFEEITIEKEGIYNIPSGKVNYVVSGDGSFEIINNGGEKLCTVLPSKNTITITDFSKRYDQISLIHFPYLFSMNDLVYRTNPLQIFLSREQKLILTSLEASELTEDNFVFQKANEGQKKKSVQMSFSSMITLGIIVSCVGLVGFIVKMNENTEDDSCPWKDTLQDANTVTVVETKNENIVDLESPNEKLSSELSSVLTGSSGSDSKSDDSGGNNRSTEDRALSDTTHGNVALPESPNEKLSSGLSSVLLSSSESDDSSDSDNSSKIERELSETDLNLFSSLPSFFSSNNDNVNTLNGKLSVLKVFCVVDPEEQEEEEEQEEQSFVFPESDDDRETDHGDIDIEGNYNDIEESDMEEDISFQSFNNSPEK